MDAFWILLILILAIVLIPFSKKSPLVVPEKDPEDPAP
jgi:hypothetical protein